MSKILTTALVLLGMAAAGTAQDGKSGSRSTFDIGGVNFVVLIPHGVDVALSPYRVTTSNEMSLLFYKVAVNCDEPVQGLRWNLYVTGAGGRLVSKDSWWDVGEWKPKSVTEESTVFTYGKHGGTTIVVALQEVISTTGVKSVDPDEVERNLSAIINDVSRTSPRPKFVRHVKVSDEDERDLARRSLEQLFTNDELRESLRLRDRVRVLWTSNTNIPDALNVELLRPEQVSEYRAGGESVNYFEYGGLKALGDAVKVIYKYQAPTAKGNLTIPKGVRIEFNYLRDETRFVLKGIKTEHF